MVDRPLNLGFRPSLTPSMLGVYDSLGFPARTSIPHRHSLNQRCRPETEFAEDADAYYILVKLPRSMSLTFMWLLWFYCYCRHPDRVAALVVSALQGRPYEVK
jgi:hypothetical protein